jgi:RimJ/RimL family protein N-acetyltransferase
MALLSPVHFTLKNGSEALVRSFGSEDVNSANAFARQIGLESTHTLKYEGMPEMPRDKLIAQWTENQSHPVNLGIGAFVGGELVGNLRFFQRSPTHPWIKHVAAFAMAVKRDYWGQGVGAKLLQTMETHARSCGISRIEAEVRTANDRGVALYTKNGFKIEGKREKAALIDGTFHDEFYIAKQL